MKKFSLKELESFLPVMNLQEQNAIVGGGFGTLSCPYTVSEYLAMVSKGTWSGGYVEGFGQYIGPNSNTFAQSNNGSLYGSCSGNGSWLFPYSVDTFLNWYGYWPGGYVYGFGYVQHDVVIYGSKYSTYLYDSYSYSYSYSSPWSSYAGTNYSSNIPEVTVCDLLKKCRDSDLEDLAKYVGSFLKIYNGGAGRMAETVASAMARLGELDRNMLIDMSIDAINAGYAREKVILVVVPSGLGSIVTTDYYLKSAKTGVVISHFKKELFMKPYKVR